MPTDTDEFRDESLWSDYRRTGDNETLLLRYAPIVRQVAARLGADLPPHVETADLVSAGIFGLMDAIEKFDPDRGVRFETYAASRIRGSILDELRAIDWVPRSVRARIRDAERVRGTLLMTLHRTPTEAEVAAELGIAVTELRKMYAEVARRRVVPLEDVRGGRGLEQAEAAALDLGLPTGRPDQPGDALEAAEQARAVVSAIRALDDRDRAVINLYYYRGLKLTEIGRVLGVTEARVSQLHTRARLALKKTLLAMDI